MPSFPRGPTPPVFPVKSLSESDRRTQAANFIATAQWRVFLMRGGTATDAQLGKARVRLRLFAHGCPPHALREVIQLLAESSPIHDLVANSVVQPGVWYPRTAWWARDAQTGQADSTFSIYRELADGPVTESGTVENGCSETTTIRYVWDALILETLPAFSQGTSVKLAGVSRDPETGLLNYYVATTVRSTVVIPEHVIAEDLLSITYGSEWTGLRGTPAAPTDHLGATVTVPSPAGAAIGELISVDWAKNPDDCTYTAKARRQVAKEGVLVGASCARDIFSERDSVAYSAVATALGHAPAATDGVVTKHVDKLRPDGLYDTEKTEEREETVEEARIVSTLNSAQEVTATTNRGVTDPGAPIAPASGQHTRSREKTPGGLFVVVDEVSVPLLQSLTFGSESRADQLSETSWAHNAEAKVDATAAAGRVIRATSRPNEFGKFDNTVERITPVLQETEYQSSARADQVTGVVWAHNADTKIEAVALFGAVVTASSKPNEFGKFDNVTETTVAILQDVEYVSETRADQSTAVTWAHNASAWAEATSVDGAIVKVSSRPNEFGKYDNVTEVVTPILQAVSYQSTARADQTTETEWESNAAAKANATAVPGSVVNASSKPNAFGKFDNVVETITPALQTVTYAATARADQTAEVVWAHNADGKANAVAISGKIINASSRPNEFGKFDNSVETITPLPQSIQHVSEVRADQSTEVLLEKNAEAAAEAEDISGKITRASSRPNEFGKFDNTTETITPLPQAITFIASTRADQSAMTCWEHNASTPAEATVVEGKTVTASSRPNEFGKFDNTVETVTPIEQSVEFLSESRADQVTAIVWAHNADTQADASAEDGKIVRASSRPNEFGKFDNSVETITPIPQTVSYQTVARADQTVSVVWVSNADAQADAAAVEGQVITASSKPNAFGKFDTVVETTVPIPLAVVTSVRTFDGKWGTLTTRWWRNQALGYGEANAGADGGHKSISIEVNEFGLEDGRSSHFLPDDSGDELDQIPIADVWTTCYKHMTRSNAAGKTERSIVSFYKIEAFTQTVSAALDQVAQINNLADYSISSFTSAAGDRMYHVTAETVPQSYGAWALAPGQPE